MRKIKCKHIIKNAAWTLNKLRQAGNGIPLVLVWSQNGALQRKTILPSFLMQFSEHDMNRKRSKPWVLRFYPKPQLTAAQELSKTNTKNHRCSLPQPWATSWKFSRDLIILGAVTFCLSWIGKGSDLKAEILCKAHFILLFNHIAEPEQCCIYPSAYTPNGSIFQQDIVHEQHSAGIGYKLRILLFKSA